MPLKVQRAVLALVSQVLRESVETRGKMPAWLIRPGKVECGARWPLISEIYWELTGSELPEEMPKNNWRRVDGILRCAGSAPRIVEVDESQHFNCYRAMTLRLYPPELPLAFDRRTWIQHSQAKPAEQSGGWAAPKPPLFPNAGGRHLQRAFRDALADVLPLDYGFLPTLRIGYFEVEPWIETDSAAMRMNDLLNKKIPRP
jgi:hypothetical protein